MHISLLSSSARPTTSPAAGFFLDASLLRHNFPDVIRFPTFLFCFADVRPPEQVIDLGRKARLQCLTDSVIDHITWMKDGRLLPNRTRIVVSKHTLQIFNLQREDYGVYQCFVTRGNREVEATAQLRLGGQLSLRN